VIPKSVASGKVVVAAVVDVAKLLGWYVEIEIVPTSLRGGDLDAIVLHSPGLRASSIPVCARS
jgi:hypothetical protein